MTKFWKSLIFGLKMKKSHIANMRLLQKFVIFGYFEPIFYIRSFVADIGIRLKKPKMTKNCENRDAHVKRGFILRFWQIFGEFAFFFAIWPIYARLKDIHNLHVNFSKMATKIDFGNKSATKQQQMLPKKSEFWNNFLRCVFFIYASWVNVSAIKRKFEAFRTLFIPKTWSLDA